jgi:hypothetical protein
MPSNATVETRWTMSVAGAENRAEERGEFGAILQAIA